MISPIRIARHFLSAAITKTPVGNPDDTGENSEDIRKQTKTVKEKTKALEELDQAEKKMKQVMEKGPLGTKTAVMGEIERARLNAIIEVFTDARVPDNAYFSEPEMSPTPITIVRDVEVKEQFLKDLFEKLNLQRVELARDTVINTDDGPLAVNADMKITGDEFKAKLNGIKAKGITFERDTIFHVNP